MLVEETWPSYKGIDKDGVGVIINETGYTSDVKYGRTKLFIRTPKTVFELEKLRAEIVPTLVLFLQRVRRNHLLLIASGMSSANFEFLQNKNSTLLFCYLLSFEQFLHAALARRTCQNAREETSRHLPHHGQFQEIPAKKVCVPTL